MKQNLTKRERKQKNYIKLVEEKLQVKRDMKTKLSVWAEKNVMLNGKPFSFKGHEYLRQPYDDNHPFQIEQKAVQVGISTKKAIMSIWRAAQHGNSTGYFFPDEGWANRFSMRVKEEIIKDSPKIMLQMDRRSIDNVGDRRIGKGMVHFRGLRNPKGTQETPMDIIVIDEFDHIGNMKKLSEAKQRTSHSTLKWLHYVGIPTVAGWGINALFQQSTQYNWNLICPNIQCKHYNILVETFPECLKRIDEDTVIRVCSKCGAELDTEQGAWVAKNPDSKIHGYHYTQLSTAPTDLSEVLYLWERLQAGEANPGEDLETFFREILGLPFIMAENQLTATQVLACCRAATPSMSGAQNYMGVDTGKRQWRHVIMKGSSDGGSDKNFSTLAMGEATWEQIYSDMDTYNVMCCVVDPGGNDTKTREFQADFPGRVYLIPPACYTARETVYIEFREEKGYVVANRTGTIDFLVNKIRGQKLVLPRKDLPEVAVFVKHCLNIKRIAEIKDEQLGIKTYKWIRTGDDHCVHALNYAMIASYGDTAGLWKDVANMNADSVFKSMTNYAEMGL